MDANKLYRTYMGKRQYKGREWQAYEVMDADRMIDLFTRMKPHLSIDKRTECDKAILKLKQKQHGLD